MLVFLSNVGKAEQIFESLGTATETVTSESSITNLYLHIILAGPNLFLFLQCASTLVQISDRTLSRKKVGIFAPKSE